MKKKIIRTLFVLAALSSILFVNLGNKSTAQECNDCTPIPTEPGEADHCPMHPLTIDPNIPSEITCGTPITIIDGIKPFSGVVSGNGYTLTKIDDNKFSLSCNSNSTCGSNTNQTSAVATVTITDSCNSQKIVSKTFRVSETNGGHWHNMWFLDSQKGTAAANTYYWCHEGDDVCPKETLEYIDGDKRWTVTCGGGCQRGANSREWKYLSEGADFPDGLPPCGDMYDCARLRESCGSYNNTNCYCYGGRVMAYQWRCQ